MAKTNRPRSGARRWMRRILLLTLAGVLGFYGYQRIRPLLLQAQTILYAPFEVTEGSVYTSMSMSGSIGVRAEETITNTSPTSYGELPKVRELFVQEAQKVKRDDKLLQLSNGDIYRAGIDGTINRISVAQGDTVRPNATMLQICDVDSLVVTINVDEFDISALSVGQACTITVLPLDVQFQTRIGHINRVSNAAGWVASYTVTADANAPESVWPGMQAEVSIPLEQAENVPVLPMTAISFDEHGEPHVLVKDSDGAYARREIAVGLSDGMNVEIRSGLAVGDTVWAATGVEKEEPALSLTALYKRIFGEKVVIIDRSSGAGRGGRSEMQPPRGGDGA